MPPAPVGQAGLDVGSVHAALQGLLGAAVTGPVDAARARVLTDRALGLQGVLLAATSSPDTATTAGAEPGSGDVVASAEAVQERLSNAGRLRDGAADDVLRSFSDATRGVDALDGADGSVLWSHRGGAGASTGAGGVQVDLTGDGRDDVVAAEVTPWVTTASRTCDGDLCTAQESREADLAFRVLRGIDGNVDAEFPGSVVSRARLVDGETREGLTRSQRAESEFDLQTPLLLVPVGDEDGDGTSEYATTHIGLHVEFADRVDTTAVQVVQSRAVDLHSRSTSRVYDGRSGRLLRTLDEQTTDGLRLDLPFQDVTGDGVVDHLSQEVRLVSGEGTRTCLQVQPLGLERCEGEVPAVVTRSTVGVVDGRTGLRVWSEPVDPLEGREPGQNSADLDGDGATDFLFVTPRRGTGLQNVEAVSARTGRSLWTGQWPVSSFTLVSGPLDGVAGDDLLTYEFGDDGESADLVTRSGADGNVVANFALDSSRAAIGTLPDVSGDGTADLLLTRLVNGASVVSSLASSGGSEVLLGRVPGLWLTAGVPDADGDGRADVVLQRFDGRDEAVTSQVAGLLSASSSAGVDWRAELPTPARELVDGGPLPSGRSLLLSGSTGPSLSLDARTGAVRWGTSS